MRRIEWIDMAKGWGIVLLIYGHAANDTFANWLYTFHIPLFFFLSGYVFNPDKPFPVFIKSKAKGLLLPYLTLGIPLILLNIYWGYDIISLIQSFIIQKRMFPLWFITTLFLQLLTAYFIINKVKNTKGQIIFVLCLTLIGILLWKLGVKSLPWNFDISLVTFPFFYLGFYLRKKKDFNRIFDRNKFYTYFIIFLLLNISGVVLLQLSPNPSVDLFASQFGFEPITYPTAFFGILCTIIFSNRFTIKFISYIGKNSLVFFAWQQDIALIASGIILQHLHFEEQPNGILAVLHNLAMLVSAIIILFILNEIIIRTKLRRLIGK